MKCKTCEQNKETCEICLKSEVYANLPNEHCTILQDVAELTTCVNSEIWTCTKEMRWLEKTVTKIRVDAPGQIGISHLGQCTAGTEYKEIVTVLQQAWMSDKGNIDWRDVPTVKE